MQSPTEHRSSHANSPIPTRSPRSLSLWGLGIELPTSRVILSARGPERFLQFGGGKRRICFCSWQGQTEQRSPREFPNPRPGAPLPRLLGPAIAFSPSPQLPPSTVIQRSAATKDPQLPFRTQLNHYPLITRTFPIADNTPGTSKPIRSGKVSRISATSPGE